MIIFEMHTPLQHPPLIIIHDEWNDKFWMAQNYFGQLKKLVE